jgi:hypothetical protein
MNVRQSKWGSIKVRVHWFIDLLWMSADSVCSIFFKDGFHTIYGDYRFIGLDFESAGHLLNLFLHRLQHRLHQRL